MRRVRGADARDVRGGVGAGEVGAKVEEPPANHAAKRTKVADWNPAALDMARAFEKALPSLLPDDSPLNPKGELDARGVVGGWGTIRTAFDRWANGEGAGCRGLRGFPRGADAEEKALRSLFRAMKDEARKARN